VVSGRVGEPGPASFAIKAPQRDDASSSLVLILPAAALAGPAVPPGWTVKLADERGATLLERPAAMPAVDGQHMVTAESRVEPPGWTVSVSAPWSEASALLPQILARSLGWALLALGVAVLPAWWVLRRGRPATGLEETAPAAAASKAPLRDLGTGEVEGIVGATEGRAALAARQAADAQVANVLDGMAECFLVMDRDFRIVTANRAALRLAGRPLEAVLGRTHWDVWPASDGAGLEAFYRRVAKEGSPSPAKHAAKRRAGAGQVPSTPMTGNA
jgi:PAS domain S-box-containing protein